MTQLIEWLSQIEHDCVALFSTDAGLVVNLQTLGQQEKNILRRSKEMEQAVINVVEAGVTSEQWQGLMFVMGKGQMPNFSPMFIGYTEKWGRAGEINKNLVNLQNDQSKFARWGDGSAYHIGDLSQELFRWGAYKEPEAKKREWAQSMFETYDPPRLKEPIYLCIIPWYDDSRTPSGQIRPLVEAVKELICRGHKEFPGRLLNELHYNKYC